VVKESNSEKQHTIKKHVDRDITYNTSQLNSRCELEDDWNNLPTCRTLSGKTLKEGIKRLLVL
jgi:hypothetical protein